MGEMGALSETYLAKPLRLNSAHWIAFILDVEFGNSGLTAVGNIIED